MDKETIDAIIDRIYEAGLDGSKWPTVVEKLQGLFPYSSIVLYGHDFASNFTTGIVQIGLLDDYVDRYESDFAAINIMAEAFEHSPVGTVVTSEELCGQGRLLKSQFYSDFLQPQKIGAGVGVVVLRDPNRFMALTLNCGFGKKDRHEAAMAAALQAIAPHVRRAFKLTRKIAAQSLAGRDFRAVLDLVPGAAFLLCSRGKPVQMNCKGETLLSARTAVGVDRNGRLYLTDRDADRAMARVLDSIARRDYAGVDGAVFFPTALGLHAASLAPFILETDQLETPLQVLLERRPVAILTLTRLKESMRRDIGAAARHFQLTPAEIKLATALAEGITVAEFSERSAISVHTARNQLKSVFRKTGTSRQSELVALVLRLQAL